MQYMYEGLKKGGSGLTPFFFIQNLKSLFFRMTSKITAGKDENEPVHIEDLYECYKKEAS